MVCVCTNLVKGNLTPDVLSLIRMIRQNVLLFMYMHANSHQTALMAQGLYLSFIHSSD